MHGECQGGRDRAADRQGRECLVRPSAEGVVVTETHEMRRDCNQASKRRGEDRLAECIRHRAGSVRSSGAEELPAGIADGEIP
jgi:hypothetical protein